MTRKPLRIAVCGAGPAGLSAAVTLANWTSSVAVYESNSHVAHRFHGDFQGIENWTTDIDALDDLASIGLEPNFENAPFREAVIFDPDGREHVIRSGRPLFYLVRRGHAEGDLDCGLQRQAEAHGAQLHFGAPCSSLPDGGIVATGPHRADVIAVGYVFDTAAADGVYVALSDALAPKGYAYLLISRGRGTVASCLFDDFHNEAAYLERTVEFFRTVLRIPMHNLRRFGGSGNLAIPRTARKGNILYAGEAAGFQDALAGFGLRYAVRSGHLAARALMNGRHEDYDRLWKRHLGGYLRAGIVNRYIYDRLGDRGYAKLVRRMGQKADIRRTVQNTYAWTLWKWLWLPVAARRYKHRIRGICLEEGCTCTWCRCQHQLVTAAG